MCHNIMGTYICSTVAALLAASLMSIQASESAELNNGLHNAYLAAPLFSPPLQLYEQLLGGPILWVLFAEVLCKL